MKRVVLLAVGLTAGFAFGFSLGGRASSAEDLERRGCWTCDGRARCSPGGLTARCGMTCDERVCICIAEGNCWDL